MTPEQVVAWCDTTWAGENWPPMQREAAARWWRRLRYWLADRLQPW